MGWKGEGEAKDKKVDYFQICFLDRKASDLSRFFLNSILGFFFHFPASANLQRNLMNLATLQHEKKSPELWHYTIRRLIFTNRYSDGGWSSTFYISTENFPLEKMEIDVMLSSCARFFKPPATHVKRWGLGWILKQNCFIHVIEKFRILWILWSKWLRKKFFKKLTKISIEWNKILNANSRLTIGRSSTKISNSHNFTVLPTKSTRKFRLISKQTVVNISVYPNMLERSKHEISIFPKILSDLFNWIIFTVLPTDKFFQK